MKQLNLALRPRRNRVTCLVFMLLAVVTLSLPLYADCDSSERNGTMSEERESERGMMGGGKMEMHGMMMKMMMQKSVVATSDGGIVIVAGNKITKYDKHLKLVNEVETKMDIEDMEKKMKGMMKMCPLMKGGMKTREERPEEAVSGASSDADSDHSAHH